MFLGGVDLATLDIPVRVVIGALDDIAPARELEALLDSLPLPEVDHFFAGPGLDQLRKLLKAQLVRVRPGEPYLPRPRSGAVST